MNKVTSGISLEDSRPNPLPPAEAPLNPAATSAPVAKPIPAKQNSGKTILLNQAQTRVEAAMKGAGVRVLGTDSRSSFYPGEPSELAHFLELGRDIYVDKNRVSAAIGGAVTHCSTFVGINRGNEHIATSTVEQIEQSLAVRDHQATADVCYKATFEAVKLNSTVLRNLHSG